MNQPQNILKNISPFLRSFFDSTEFTNAIIFTGKSEELQIDQIENLRTLTIQVATGEVLRDNFVAEICDQLNITRESAVRIMETLNIFVFEKIRTYMREGTEEKEEQEPDEVDASHKDMLMDSIENPKPSAAKIHTEVLVTKDPLPQKRVSYPTENLIPKTVPTVVPKKVEPPENLPQSSNPFEKILQTPQYTSTPKNPVTQKPYSSDPYKEAIE